MSDPSPETKTTPVAETSFLASSTFFYVIMGVSVALLLLCVLLTVVASVSPMWIITFSAIGAISALVGFAVTIVYGGVDCSL